ncbi:MAG: H-NS histone family protein [Burkholderiaceae bacterium]|nr:H-NS histone family protein [Burkholderiaceae bacterium]
MSNYMELRAKAEAMLAEAEVLRKQEIAGVIHEIKAKMKEYGISAEDLGAGSTSVRKSVKSKSVAPSKYRGPNGELWAGGLGRKPEWVREILSKGGSMDAYLI